MLEVYAIKASLKSLALLGIECSCIVLLNFTVLSIANIKTNYIYIVFHSSLGCPAPPQCLNIRKLVFLAPWYVSF